MSPELNDDHVVAICRVLRDHHVAYVIIGGIAARLHDTGHTTVDVDICPSRDETNLQNLTGALRALGARLRVEGDPSGIAFDPHPDMLRQVSTMTLITANGPLDLCFTPAGFADGYSALHEHAVVITVADTDLPVASLDDVVASKRAAAGPRTSSPSRPSKRTCVGVAQEPPTDRRRDPSRVHRAAVVVRGCPPPTVQSADLQERRSTHCQKRFPS